MALDEPRDGDVAFDIEGLTYLIDRDFLERVKPIELDYSESPTGSGFSVSSAAYRFSMRVFL